MPPCPVPHTTLAPMASDKKTSPKSPCSPLWSCWRLHSHPTLVSLCISPTNEGREKGIMVPHGTPGWSLLTPNPPSSRGSLHTSISPPENPPKEGRAATQQLNSSIPNVWAMKGAGKNVPDHMTGEDIGLSREQSSQSELFPTKLAQESVSHCTAEGFCSSHSSAEPKAVLGITSLPIKSRVESISSISDLSAASSHS